MGASVTGLASWHVHAAVRLDAGALVGAAFRTGAPAVAPGIAAAASADLKLIPAFAAGPYVLAYDLPLRDQPNTVRSVEVRTVGGRMRFQLALPGSRLRPYAAAGLGYSLITYPVLPPAQDPGAAARLSEALARNKGSFLEVPITLGLGYRVAKVVEGCGDVALRPSFAFTGSAFEPPRRAEPSRLGVSILVGIALNL